MGVTAAAWLMLHCPHAHGEHLAADYVLHSCTSLG